MSLTLRIENYQVLDDASPAYVVVPDSGLQAGRASGMGWVLPDASRHISGQHFEVYRQGEHWYLRDVSTNGTFLQGQRHRLEHPHRLSHGDRFQVGQYIIIADMGDAGQGGALTPDSLPARAVRMPDHSNDDPWAVGGGGYAPIDPLPPSPSARRLDDFPDDFIGSPGLAGSATPFPDAGMAVGGAAPQGGLGQLPPAPPYGARLGGGAAARPEPAPPRNPQPPGAAQPAPAPAAPDVVAAFCRGAGLPPANYANVPAEQLAEMLGASLRHVAREVMLSLQDRATAKHFALTVDRTMLGASDNNPLKFLPDPDQAIEAMFLRPRAGFQAGPAAMDEALKDLRLHQVALFAALQPALAKLLGDLAPESVEAEAEGARIAGNRKAKAWDIFVTRWDAKTAPHENGILDEFLAHFSEAYRQMILKSRGDRE
ncbi:type VI secretion system-associated FHA domain protein TagH [Paracoccus pacificus]|uniref:Type VI secretion system-associated FHA domain protein TagH n=1 Tax=Paracoccus pacificus TaxID=1463598 RepID=A0ABW4R871_9RHOB